MSNTNNDELETRWRNSIDTQFHNQNQQLAEIRERLEETCDTLTIIKTTAATTAKFEEFKEGVRNALETEREARRVRFDAMTKDIDKGAQDYAQLKTAFAVLKWLCGIMFSVGIAVLTFWPK